MEEEPTTDALRAETACTDVTTACPPDSPHRLRSLISAIERDSVAADLKWSLFVAASQSYRYDSCVRPFPPMFLDNGNKDFSALREAIECVPALSHLQSAVHTLPRVAVRLVYWVLVELKEPSFTMVEKSEVDTVVSLVPCELTVPSPSLVVRLHYDPSSAAELRWAEAKQRHSSLYAFHGSKVENFHSILHHGLQQHLTKNALFGQGVYLSSELTVCLPYSKNGLGWRHSSVAHQLSVIALCEVLDHPSVRRWTKKNSRRARAEDSIGGDVPHKVYVVPNSDLVRVRYLLVYTVYQRLNHNSSGLLVWLSQHKMVASLLVYAVILVSVGFSRSPTIARLWRNMWQTLGMQY